MSIQGIRKDVFNNQRIIDLENRISILEKKIAELEKGSKKTAKKADDRE